MKTSPDRGVRRRTNSLMELLVTIKAEIISFVGLLLVCIGVALIYLPAGLIAAGLALLIVAKAFET